MLMLALLHHHCYRGRGSNYWLSEVYVERGVGVVVRRRHGAVGE